jgi:hypothetical protein
VKQDGKQYYVSSVSIDDHSQADDRSYGLVETAYFGKDWGDYDPTSSLIINRLEPFDPDQMPWQSSNTTVVTATTWQVWVNISPTADSTSEKGIPLDTLFNNDLSYFDSTDFKTEFTTINFNISDNNLDTWVATKSVSIVKKQQEGVKRNVVDDPLKLLGYEVTIHSSIILSLIIMLNYHSFYSLNGTKASLRRDKELVAFLLVVFQGKRYQSLVLASPSSYRGTRSRKFSRRTSASRVTRKAP